ncbi:hypothetical protein M422DRAFT_164662, partial [Sphaerobolus stellatus SS14]
MDHSSDTTQHPGDLESSKARLKKIYIIDDNQHLQIQAIACKFTYMNMLWLRGSDEGFHLAVDSHYNPANRFKSVDEQLQGILYELREEIPTKWHNEIDNGILIRTFMNEMSQQRSNGSHRIRSAGPFIFGCQNDTFYNENSRVATFKEDIGFRMDEDRVGSYSKLAKILFKDYENTFDKWKIFQGEVTKSPGHHTVESAWGIREITPAAIAMAAIFTRFAASEDRNFQPIGGHTKINYQEDYEFYLEYLHKGLYSKAPSVLDVMDEWNQHFYPQKS